MAATLTAREAATLLGISPRAVRSRLQHGTLRGHKVQGVWRIPRAHLPATDEEVAAQARRAQEVRDAVEEELARGTAGERAPRSLCGLSAYRAGRRTLLATEEGQGVVFEEARRQLKAALVALGRAWPVYLPGPRLRLLDTARSEFGAAIAILGLEPTLGLQLADELEREALPALAGMCRATERRRRRDR